MIDQFSDDGTGWARFSDDMTMRYRLARSLRGWPLVVVDDRFLIMNENGPSVPTRAVFLLLNPSDATAFKPDPTVTECRKRGADLGADVVEVANLDAFRSPYPTDLWKRAVGSRGDGPDNNIAILQACRGAFRVIAGWGNDGGRDGRDRLIRRMLEESGVELYHLGTTKDGYPKHPLARGKHRIPADLQPQIWRAA